MSEKNKSILIVSLIIFVLSCAFLYQGISQHNKALDQLILNEEEEMDDSISALREFSFEPYKLRIQNLLDTSPSILQAFALRDRKLLHQLVLPRYAALKKENPYFHVMHFHLPDSTTLLRMHKPQYFGDDLKGVRPIVDAVHEHHTPLSGFEIGRHGPYFRVVHPVFHKDTYIGALEFGIKAHQLLDILQKKTNFDLTAYFPKKRWQKATKFDVSGLIDRGENIILSHGNPLFSALPGTIFNRHDNTLIEINNKTYGLHIHPIFMTFRGESIGGILLLHDLSQLFGQKKKFIIKALLFTGSLLFFTFVILYLSFGKMVGAMENEITARQKTEKALRRSEQKYRLLFDTAPDGIEILDEKGFITDCNKSKIEHCGYSREELIGKHITEMLAPEDKEKFQENFPKIQSLQSVNNECTLIKKDGTPLYVWRKGTPLTDDNGNFIGALAYDRDITDRKEAEEEKAVMETKLRRAQKMEAIGLLAGGVAHDLNNILSGIVSYPELLLMDMPEDSPLRRPLTIMQESGHRAAAVVADLLTVARGIASAKVVANINVLVRDYFNSAEFLKLKESHPHVSFAHDLENDLLNISCSSVHINKIIMNLANNGAEAIAEKGKVTISTRNCYLDRPLKGYDEVSSGEYSLLSVTDSGSGISPADLDRIFEPFYSKKVMGRSGTGLGLAVVWNTVLDHNGYINVTSNEKGTSFDLYFPVSRKLATGEEEQPEVAELCGNGETILIVDDEANQRDIAGLLLGRLNYKTQAVASGEEAVDYLRRNRVDLIILDMIMDPGMNGRQTYEKISEFNPGQKAIIASGFAENEEVREAQRLGAGCYLKKPYTLAQIGQAVKEELEK